MGRGKENRSNEIKTKQKLQMNENFLFKANNSNI